MILLDTHTLVWALMAPDLLSEPARTALQDAPSWAVSAASLYEITYKHGLGKWPDVAPMAAPGLSGRLVELGFDLVPADAAIMEMAGGMAWQHRDPFDRLIVATCLTHSMALVSKDTTLDSVGTPGFTRVW